MLFSPGNGRDAWVGLGYHKIDDDTDTQFVEGTWNDHIDFGFGGHGLNNDISLIHLKTPVAMNSEVKAIGISSSEPKKGLELLVSGWGNLDRKFYSVQNQSLELIGYWDCMLGINVGRLDARWQQSYQVKPVFSVMCTGSELRKQWTFPS